MPLINKTIYLVPDTNVFEQCKPLQVVDWNAWSESAQIVVVVTQPVVEEIDRHKSQGNTRIARKAKKANSLFEMALRAGLSLVLRDEGPRVILTLRPEITPATSLHPALDYSRNDHRLIGCAYALSQAHEPLFLMTGDTGVKLNAHMVGLPYQDVPKSWALPPELDERDSLIENLRRGEPRFRANFVDLAGRPQSKLTGTSRLYAPPTSDEVTLAMERIERRYPMEAAFGSRERKTRTPAIPAPWANITNIISQEYVPATDEAITEYMAIAYPAWLLETRKALESLHDRLQRRVPWPLFACEAENFGVRAAESVRISFVAEGTFLIEALSKTPSRGEAGAKREPLLPKPPVAPMGYWRPIHAASVFEAFRGLRVVDVPRAASVKSLLAAIPRSRNPNLFYFEDQDQPSTGRDFSLTAEQWRHGEQAERICGSIYPRNEGVDMRGVLVCRINAANASEVVTIEIGVDISIERVSAITELDVLLAEIDTPREPTLG